MESLLKSKLYLPGDLMKEEDVLAWLFHHVDHEEIADVTDEMLDKLIANEPHLAVLFCQYPQLYFFIWVKRFRAKMYGFISQFDTWARSLKCQLWKKHKLATLVAVQIIT